VSLTVVLRETALRNLARIRGEDKDLFTRTRRAISALAEQPYPEGAVAWGATGVYRLHAGDIRILYEVDDQAAMVYIINIGIIA
jgi:mRNA-degrading endonuclease RelE of RelBE toxin-antitoxin system